MKNWKTTLCGGLIAAAIGLTSSTDPTLHMVGQALSIIAPILLGLVSKDYNKTGV